MIQILGKNINLKLVLDEDIDFIIDIRNGHKNKGNLSNSALTFIEQKKWLDDYKKREEIGKDFYFLINDAITNEKIGLIRVYDILDDRSFEQGSLILKEGLNPKYILEVFILIYRFAFEQLNLLTGRLRVKIKNKVGNKFHKSYGAKMYYEDEELKYYEVKTEVIENLEKIFSRFGG